MELREELCDHMHTSQDFDAGAIQFPPDRKRRQHVLREAFPTMILTLHGVLSCRFPTASLKKRVMIIAKLCLVSPHMVDLSLKTYFTRTLTFATLMWIPLKVTPYVRISPPGRLRIF